MLAVGCLALRPIQCVTSVGSMVPRQVSPRTQHCSPSLHSPAQAQPFGSQHLRPRVRARNSSTRPHPRCNCIGTTSMPPRPIPIGLRWGHTPPSRPTCLPSANCGHSPKRGATWHAVSICWPSCRHWVRRACFVEHDTWLSLCRVFLVLGKRWSFM